jgi:hypothetical protein
MIRKHRCWETVGEDDPGAGLLNLFDVWIAFSVALLLALVTYLQRPDVLARAAENGRATPAEVEQLAQAKKIPHYRPTNAPLTGAGTRLGTAYQLANGEVVYVPDEGAGQN